MAFATLSATSRMLGISKSTAFAAFNKVECYTALIESGTGLRSVRLISAVDLYDMALQYNQELAKNMGRAGANLYLLKEAGYKVNITEPISAPEFTLPTSEVEWIEYALKTKKEAIAAEQVAKQLAAQIETNRDATAHGNAVSHASNCRDVGSFGQSLVTPIGRTKMFALLRELGFIKKDSPLPYQIHIDRELFEVIQVISENKYGTRTDSKALITGKGELAIVKAMEKRDRKEMVTCQMEKEVAMVD